jgi:hypothetical protein
VPGLAGAQVHNADELRQLVVKTTPHVGSTITPVIDFLLTRGR